MATEQNTRTLSLLASGALASTDLYKAVKIDSNGQVALAVAGDAAIGVLYSTAAAAGEAVEVAIGGVVKAMVAATVTRGALLKSNASGKFAAAVLAATNTSDGGTAADALLGSNVLGIALEVGGTDAIIEMLWYPIGASPTTIS